MANTTDMLVAQPVFSGGDALVHTPPSTRYQGSKLKLLDWIGSNIQEFEFHTALEPFGGTGCVSYMLKSKGKKVTYNDCLKFNHAIGTAVIENQSAYLAKEDIEFVLSRHPGYEYGTFIETKFKDVYYTEEENRWLDVVCQNIPQIPEKYKRALAYFALFQACIIKRPYNLFHRKNLYMRTSDIERGFGNKATWDTPFEEHFMNFAKEANQSVFDSKVACAALCKDALEIEGQYDLVYIDTPYLNANGIGVDYHDFYHFLEGLLDYEGWPERINEKKKHFPLKGQRSSWSNPKTCRDAFRDLFEKYKDSILVVSYRSDGIPSEEELVALLKEVKRNIRVVHYGEYKYVLSRNGASKEILLIGY